MSPALLLTSSFSVDLSLSDCFFNLCAKKIMAKIKNKDNKMAMTMITVLDMTSDLSFTGVGCVDFTKLISVNRKFP